MLSWLSPFSCSTLARRTPRGAPRAAFWGAVGLCLLSGCPGESAPAQCAADSCPEGETCVVDSQGELHCFVAQDPLAPTACTTDADCAADQRCVDTVGGPRQCIYRGRDAGPATD